MAAEPGVRTARRTMGKLGAFLPNVPFTTPASMGDQRAAVSRLERAGFSMVWVNEGVGGKDALVQSAVLLAATTELAVGTGVASMWARPPATAHGAAALIEDAFPGRFVLGLGVGYPFQAEAVGSTFDRPLSRMRRYLADMPIPHAISPAPAVRFPRILGANGPSMLELAGDAADGAIPTLVPARYTSAARAILGPDKVLVIGLAVVLDNDADRARRSAERFASAALGRADSPYARNLARLGYSGGDLVDAAVVYGSLQHISSAVRDHLDAGADHVRISIVASDFGAGVDGLDRVARSAEFADLIAS